MWAKGLKELVLLPLLRRVGTWVAASLVVGGGWLCDKFEACGLVTESGANVVVAYGIAVLCLVFDLLVSAADKQAAIRKAGGK